MPHLILEYSANIIEEEKIPELFQECHVLLAEMLPTDIQGCKSRAYKSNTYLIGSNQPNNGFVHVDLKVLPGRTKETLQQVGLNMMTLLQNYFSESLQQLNLQITLEISELQTYFKIT